MKTLTISSNEKGYATVVAYPMMIRVIIVVSYIHCSLSETALLNWTQSLLRFEASGPTALFSSHPS